MESQNSNSQLVTNGNKGTKTLQYVAGVLASFAAFYMGTLFGWTSQISTQLKNGALGFPITDDELGWIGAIMPLGGAALTLFTGSFSEFLGRKLCMLVLVVPATIGWCLIIWSQSVVMLYCGRFITGMVGGSYCMLTTLYTSEIAQKEIRGALGSYTQLMIAAGVLFTNVVAIILDVIPYTLVCAAVPIGFGAIFIFMPETPFDLVRREKFEEARAVLIKLRGEKYNVDNELKEIESFINENRTSCSGFQTIKASLKKRSTQKACVIGLALKVFKITTGVDAIASYTSLIFESANTGIDEHIAVIILNTFPFVSAIFQSLVVDKSGRRVLLWGSSLAMTICLTIMGFALSLKQRNIVDEDYYIYINYLPLVSLILFVISFSFGLGPVSWLILGEIFPDEIKNLASSVVTCISWIAGFAVTKLFVVVHTCLGLDIIFYMFAACTFLAMLFVLFVVPETKNKTFEEIQKEL